MKICLISDTHEMHEQVIIPPCDVLIHAGDLTFRGQASSVNVALSWLDQQPAKFVICIAGNHDFLFQRYPDLAQELISKTRINYLENNGVVIQGVHFWGSPYTPEFMEWAFMYDRAAGVNQWDEVPEDVDVLITHGPPFGILDRAAPGMPKLGCQDLARRVNSLPNLKLHVFGHIHGGYGHEDCGSRQFYNASVVDEAYRPVNQPHLVDIYV